MFFQSQPFHPTSIVGKLCHAMHEWNVVRTLLNTRMNIFTPPEHWTAPPPLTHKQKVDGSFHNINGTAGIEGIIRNSSGRLLLAFACAITTNLALEAKMQALLRGTQLCVANGFTDVIVEGDSCIIWNSLNSTPGVPWSLIHLWHRILKTLENIPR